MLMASEAPPSRSSSRIARSRTRLSIERMSPSCSMAGTNRSEEHTSELQSLMRISYAVFRLKKKNEADNMPFRESKTSSSHHQIGREHDRTPLTNAQSVRVLLHERTK